ncbi:hypothetical protein PUN28_002463 [Cardiocondyla obscurior]|uniref:Uncharacterized protein n=1 Tax=Cardiocondyla obscurior TaxID=286306 RepID=A0AAW2GUD0_9HYME
MKQRGCILPFPLFYPADLQTALCKIFPVHIEMRQSLRFYFRSLTQSPRPTKVCSNFHGDVLRDRRANVRKVARFQPIVRRVWSIEIH